MLPDREMVAIVDETNLVIGAIHRRQMRRERLIHRACYILVFNSKGELFVHKRTTNKDIYPGYYDIAAGGVVLAGESYEDSAQRELAEELGIHGKALQDSTDFYFEDNTNRVWGRVFSCVHDGEVTLQPEEVESGAFLSLEEVRKLSMTQPFTPDGLFLLSNLSHLFNDGIHSEKQIRSDPEK